MYSSHSEQWTPECPVHYGMLVKSGSWLTKCLTNDARIADESDGKLGFPLHHQVWCFIFFRECGYPHAAVTIKKGFLLEKVCIMSCSKPTWGLELCCWPLSIATATVLRHQKARWASHLEDKAQLKLLSSISRGRWCDCRFKHKE